MTTLQFISLLLTGFALGFSVRGLLEQRRARRMWAPLLARLEQWQQTRR